MINHFIKNRQRKYIYLLLYPFYLIVGILRKIHLLPREYFIFGSGGGNAFIDNSKYSFLLNSSNTKTVWVTHSKDVVNQLKNKGINNVVQSQSFKGIFYQLKAKMAIVSHGTFDLFPPLLMGVDVFQYWHGIPIKKIGKHVRNNEVNSIVYIFWKILFKVYPHLNNYYCNYFVDHSKSGYYLDFSDINAKICNYGFPRLSAMDRKHNHNIDLSPDLDKINMVKNHGKKIILYIPTYRNYESIEQQNYIFSTVINQFCNDKIFIVLKSHFLLDIPNLNSNSYLVYQDKDPYPLLQLTDGLITDYSSIGIDYLLLNKPVYFYTYDMDQYIDSPGCYFDLDDLFGHLKSNDLETIFNRIKAELFNGIDNSDLRENILNKLVNKITMTNEIYDIDSIYKEVKN
jgi:CDP-glycerol glycerophosphotransferase (TagB/SpsB family)